MKKVYILAALSLVGQTCWAQIREFHTARLTSTAGTGVASILSTEAAILNPAASAFFQGSSFSYQSYKTRLNSESDERRADNLDFPNNSHSQGFFLADHSGPVKGGVAYIQQKENFYQRKRMVLHGAAPIGPATSMGFSYNYILDTLPRGSSRRHQVHHQASAGLTHVIDEKTTLGLVVIDPTRTTPDEERVLAGFQFTLADRFVLMGDVGAQYTKNVNEKYLWRAAVQINLFGDFFLRAGKFYDNIKELEGNGWGASWIGPRLGVEFAQKFSEQMRKNSYIYRGEKIVDTTLSAVIKF